ncbi:MAG: hypothetical protein IK136_00970 [Oscillospiraceae bacterium]|nr:hypothetical protein [Oscillospiraceae bacterium]
MNAETLYDVITNLPDELIDEAETHRFRKSRAWVKWAAAAAAVIAVAVGVGGMVSGRIQTPFAAHSGGGGTGNGGENGQPYMFYAGPVLPLTAPNGAGGVTAERRVDYDFSPYATHTVTYGENDGESYSYEMWLSEAIVTDAYTLKNETDEAVTLPLLYPAVLDLYDYSDRLPAITVNGQAAETTVYTGDYTGGFQGVLGANDPDGSANLKPIRDWEGFEKLLSDGRYQASAMEPLPSLNVPVTVYKVSDYVVAHTRAEYPSLQFSFKLDFSRTQVMTYGSNGGTNSPETGRCSRIVGGLGDEDCEPEPMYIILYGDDIDGYELQGYRNMGAEAGAEIDVTATVTRYETTMDALIRQFVDKRMSDEHWNRHQDSPGPGTVCAALPRETLYGLFAKLLCDDGCFGDGPKDRYSFGILEDGFEAYSQQRVLYLAFDVTVPANGSVEVTAVMHKSPSRHYLSEPDKDTEDYDLATRLGSTLELTEQRASVNHTEEIEMVGNSFGFDIENGVTEVTLDPAVDHYRMQVTKK